MPSRVPVEDVQPTPSEWTGAWDARPGSDPDPAGATASAASELPLRIPDRLRLPLDHQRPRQEEARADLEVDPPTEELDDDSGHQHAADEPDTSAAPPDEGPPADPVRSEPADAPAAWEWPTMRVEPPPSVLGETLAPSQGAIVAVSDLSPDAPSALDGAPPAGVAVAVQDDPAYEQEPIEDEADHEPPRGWPERLAALVFVIALVAVAWYLATNL